MRPSSQPPAVPSTPVPSAAALLSTPVPAAPAQGYEIPRDFIVELDPFSKDNHLLTDSGKPARGKLKAKCARGCPPRMNCMRSGCPLRGFSGAGTRSCPRLFMSCQGIPCRADAHLL